MHNPAQAPEGAQRGVSPAMTARLEGATIPTSRKDGIAEYGALTGAGGERHTFRPLRALRALADGYANGALRALAALRLKLHNPSCHQQFSHIN